MNDTSFQWDFWRSRFREAGLFLLRFARNPIEGMRHLPDWDWQFLLVCQAIASAACAVAAGIAAKSIGSILTGLIFSPITNAIITAVIAGFFYYTFGFVFNRPAPYRKIFIILVFAQLPSLLLWTMTPLLPPISLLGLAASAALLLVGFVDGLQQDRRAMVRLLSVIYALFVIFWITNAIHQRRQTEVFREQVSPKSLDILEQELGR